MADDLEREEEPDREYAAMMRSIARAEHEGLRRRSEELRRWADEVRAMSRRVRTRARGLTCSSTGP